MLVRELERSRCPLDQTAGRIGKRRAEIDKSFFTCKPIRLTCDRMNYLCVCSISVAWTEISFSFLPAVWPTTRPLYLALPPKTAATCRVALTKSAGFSSSELWESNSLWFLWRAKLYKSPKQSVQRGVVYLNQKSFFISIMFYI